MAARGVFYFKTKTRNIKKWRTKTKRETMRNKEQIKNTFGVRLTLKLKKKNLSTQESFHFLEIITCYKTLLMETITHCMDKYNIRRLHDLGVTQWKRLLKKVDNLFSFQKTSQSVSIVQRRWQNTKVWDVRNSPFLSWQSGQKSKRRGSFCG